MSEQPWYHAGLRFQCTGCGDCCTGAPGYVWVNQAEIEAMAKVLGLPVERFQERFVRMVGIRRSLIELDGGDCVFFDNRARRCRVYEARPRQCRTWPFWASNLRDREAWDAMAENCPGANRGKLVPLETIQRQKVTMHL